jgi:sugar O-acyltransferase (sialic acid O-acetyltransferase NeuD family)
MNVVIIGAGGHGRVVLDILRHDLDIKLIGFIDDDKRFHHKLIDGFPVLGDTASLKTIIPAHKLDAAIVAVGDNHTRARIFEKLSGLGLKKIRAIHHDALIARGAEIGEGAVIAAGVVVNPGTKIGDNVIINTGVILDYGSVVEDHVHISPGVILGSMVTVKKYTHVGIGVAVVEELTVGENVTVGAGAVVLASIPDNTLAVGVPARVIRHKSQTAGQSEV